MTEQELRLLVRDAISRQRTAAAASMSISEAPAAPAARHPSHGLLAVLAGADGDGSCVIEPAVSCNHCGYCKSYGH